MGRKVGGKKEDLRCQLAQGDSEGLGRQAVGTDEVRHEALRSREQPDDLGHQPRRDHSGEEER
eukprot:10143893-Alexandrium_andersonii.AAC.1